MEEKPQSWLLMNVDLEQILKLATMMPRTEYFKLIMFYNIHLHMYAFSQSEHPHAQNKINNHHHEQINHLSSKMCTVYY